MPRRKEIGDSPTERYFGADDGEIDLFVIRDREKASGIGYVSRNASRNISNAWVSRRADDGGDSSFVCKLPGERMLTGAGADDENFHEERLTAFSRAV